MKILRKTAKVVAWIVGSLVGLVLILFLLLQLPSVQNWAKDRAVAWLQGKIGTRVSVRRLAIAFPKKVVLEGVYFEDQRHDTLLAGERLAVDIALLKLLKSEVEVNNLELTGIRANIYRSGSDTAFNYDYIVKAFASAPPTQPVDTTAALTFDINRVALERISASYRDDQTGMDAAVRLGRFETRLKEFDPDRMRYAVPRVLLTDVVARVKQYKPLAEPKPMAVREAESNEPITVALQLGTIDLKRIQFAYDNTVQDVSARLALGAFSAEADTVDLQRLFVRLRRLALTDTRGVVRLGPTQPAQVVAQETGEIVQAQVNNPWRVLLEAVHFTNVDFKFDNDGMARVPRGMDYAHLDVQDLLLDAEDIALTPTVYQGQVVRGELQERNSKFDLRALRTDFHYDDTGVVLNDLRLETDKTLLRDRIVVGWPSLDTLPKDPGVLRMDLNLRNSRIGTRDVLTFVPLLATLPPFSQAPDAVFAVDMTARGTLRDLTVPNLVVSGLSGTRVRVSGTVRGLPDPVRTFYNLNIAEARTTQADLAKLAPPGSIPPTVRVPEWVSVRGTFVGRAQDFTTKLDLQSPRGRVDATAYLRDFGAAYAVNATTQALDIGYLTKQEATIGRVSAKVQARGSGFDPKTAVAQFQATVFSAFANGYTYKNVAVSGKLERGIATVRGASRDPNVAVAFDAVANLKGQYPAVRARVDLDSIDLQALKLSPTPFRAHGDILADFASLNPDNPVGTLRVANGVFFANGKRFQTDTLTVAAAPAGDSGYAIRVGTEALTADLWGRYKLTQIAPAVLGVINRYYTVPGYKPVATEPQQWTLAAVLRPSPLLYSLAPQLRGSDTVRATVNFNSEAADLNALVLAPRLMFGTTQVDSIVVRTATTADALTYAVTLDGANLQPYRLYQTSLSGGVANNELGFSLNTRDADAAPKYVIAGVAAQTADSGIRLSLSPDSLLLDYDRWTIAPTNLIRYSPAGIVAQDFELSNGEQRLRVASTTPSPASPLNLQFTNFRIATLTDFAEQDSLLLDGLLNGVASVTGPTSATPIFESDLTIQDLMYKRDTLGTVVVRADNKTSGTITTNVTVEGGGNDIRLSGDYIIAGQKLDMNLNIGNLNLAKLPPLSEGQISNAGGALRGSINIDGTVSAPQLAGSVHFDSAFITPTLLGARYNIPADNVFITPQGIRFDTFTLVDSAGNKAVLDGSIATTNYTAFQFGLTFRANNFQAVNAVRRPGSDQAFYGRLNLSTDLRIGGSLTAPDVTGSVRVNEGTDFKALLPATDPEIVSRQGVVRFVDRSDPDRALVFAGIADSTQRQAGVSGVTANVNIQTDSSARFTMVIDERNGDALSLRGTSNLSATLDRSGKTSLTGPFQLQEGSYLLTLNFLRRQFNIQPGSIITWTGDPTTAQTDITAVYTANTSSIDLVGNQLIGTAQSELNRYKQRLPFQVLLKMQGELLKPVITFDVQLPDQTASQWPIVATKLQQLRSDESELNKQVFALLLLNRFVGENPLQDGGASGNAAENYVRQSAANILTDQLNRLAGNLISGVDLNFGVSSSEDYNSGDRVQRTDVTVGVSKRLLNDRLRVNVGSNFEVEGAQQANSNASAITGDVALEYLLTKDGRYLIRTYRRNQYQDVVVGQVVETGATFGVQLDYDRVREFFEKPEETRRRRMQRRSAARQTPPTP